MGAYISGSDPELDAALKAWPQIQAFLQQDADVAVPIYETESLLAQISPPNQ